MHQRAFLTRVGPNRFARPPVENHIKNRHKHVIGQQPAQGIVNPLKDHGRRVLIQSVSLKGVLDHGRVDGRGESFSADVAYHDSVPVVTKIDEVVEIAAHVRFLECRVISVGNLYHSDPVRDWRKHGCLKSLGNAAFALIGTAVADGHAGERGYRFEQLRLLMRQDVSVLADGQ